MPTDPPPPEPESSDSSDAMPLGLEPLPGYRHMTQVKTKSAEEQAVETAKPESLFQQLRKRVWPTAEPAPPESAPEE